MHSVMWSLGCVKAQPVHLDGPHSHLPSFAGGAGDPNLYQTAASLGILATIPIRVIQCRSAAPHFTKNLWD